MASIRVTHFTDPGCPWAYSALPALTALRWRYGAQLEWRHVTIGLAERAAQYEDRGYTPLRMARGFSGFRSYGMPFASQVKPRMAATACACRVLVAVRRDAPELEWTTLRALQFTQFTTALPLDGDEALRHALALVPGLDAERVLERSEAPDVLEAYEADRREARTAAGSPSELLGKTTDTDGAERYTAPSLVFERGGRRLEGGGFQPVEAYEVLIANLDPGLARRGAPGDVAELLEAFPHGLTTREVAECLRTGNAPADVDEAEHALLEVAGSGRAVPHPLGDGTLWLDATSRCARRVRLVATAA